jgi:hydrogenase nickel incorporation protein HypA/HybF
MHEMSIAQGIVDIVKEEMAKADASLLRSVRLNIGMMSAIVPDALAFGFEVITTGTDLEGARLIMDMVPVQGHCIQCKHQFEVQDYAFSCPACESGEIEIVSGQDLSIVEIEVD